MKWAWVSYVILLVVGVPWYWRGDDLSNLLGVPLWVWVAVACSFLASLVTLALLFSGKCETDANQRPGSGE